MILRFHFWILLIIQASYVLADASFWDVRTSLEKDRSGKGGDPKDKYFRAFPISSVSVPAPLTQSYFADESTYVLTSHFRTTSDSF